MEKYQTRESYSIQFKKATVADVPILLELEKSVAEEGYYSAYSDDLQGEIENNHVFLIEKDGQIIGFTSYEKEGSDVVHMDSLVIRPDFQSQGIGKQATLYRLQEIGNAKRIDVTTHPDNFRVIKLYQSLGFVIESRKENYYGDGQPRLVLVKEN